MPREELPNFRLNQTQEFDWNGLRTTMTVGYKANGEIGEIFLNAGHGNSMIDVLMSDAAIIASIALQYGAPLQVLAHAIKRDPMGVASSPVGAALDRACGLSEVQP